MRGRIVDYNQPINWASPLNYKLVSQWIILSKLAGGNRLYDLAKRNHGIFTNNPTLSGLSNGRLAIVTDKASSQHVTTDIITLGNPTGMTVGAAFSWAWQSGQFEHALGLCTNGFDDLRMHFRSVNTDNLVVGIRAASGIQFHACGAMAASYRNFNHWIITAGNTTWAVYLNGSPLASGTKNAGFDFANTQFSIGGQAGAANAFASLKCSQAFIISRELSASDVGTIYQEFIAKYPNILNYIRTRYFLPTSQQQSRRSGLGFLANDRRSLIIST